MFGRSKRKKRSTAVDANEVLSQEQQVTGDEEIETTLSIPDNWNISSEERYVFAFHNNESPKLKVNQLSIYGMELKKLRDGRFVITGLIRNTVPKKVKFGKTTILLLDGEKEVIAKKEFDLAKLGHLSKNSARPWKFVFDKDDIIKDMKTPIDDWSLAFELKKKHQLDLEESWEKSIGEEVKESLKKIVAQAEPLKPGEVNFMGIQAKQKDDEAIAVTILIRNGSDKDVTLKQVPLGLKDASGNEVARGSFKLQDFTVKANTSKPWTFIFPSSVIKEDEVDLSKWKAYPIQ